jgi:glycosyltransferase involved in cell wall biosynthesis
MPVVSVVVPLFNKQAYVRRALESIFSQTFTDFELIVVDDGSTDQGPSLVETFSDPRLRLIRQSNGGPGAARNRGLKEASGDFVAFLDADDAWSQDYLEKGVRILQEHPVAAVTCAYLDCPGDRSSTPMWLRRGLKPGLQTVDTSTCVESLVTRLAFMTPCTTIARADVVRQWGGFYEENMCRYGEDAWLWLRVLLNHTVLFDLNPRVRIFNDASGLSKIAAPHPMEPFLERPEAIEEACPSQLRQLVAEFHAARAFKLACVWSYWGKWQDARRLRGRFRIPGDHRLPYYWASWACATPAGAAAGWILRRMKRARRIPSNQ